MAFKWWSFMLFMKSTESFTFWTEPLAAKKSSIFSEITYYLLSVQQP